MKMCTSSKIAFLAVIAVCCDSSTVFGAYRGEIVSGETKTGYEITGPAYEDSWDFDGQTGERVIISVEATSGSLSPRIKLYPPDGGPSEDVGSGLIDHQLLQSGTYTVVVYDFDYDDTGRYNITLLNTQGAMSSSIDPNGGPISSGETFSGAIDVASDIDGFQFEGNINDRVIISVEATSGSLSPRIKLYPPDGGPSEDVGSGLIDRQLLQSGTYTIVVYDFDYDDTGTHNITFDNLQ